MKSKIEIIEETIAYYEEDPSRRAMIGTSCAYKTDNGNMCAVGRCLTEQGLAFASEFANESDVYGLYETNEGLDDILKEEYRGHELSFWSDLQSLHDTSSYWKAESKEHRELVVSKLKRKYAKQHMDVF